MKNFLQICIVSVFLACIFPVYGSTSRCANRVQKNTRFGVEGVIASSGIFSLGLVTYGEHFEAGVFGGGKASKSKTKTATFIPGVFVGYRKFIANTTIFATGLDLLTKIGKIDGEKIHYSYTLGPYVSLEEMLTNNVMLSFWYNPYLYTREKVGKVVTRTHSFESGGIGIQYLF